MKYMFMTNFNMGNFCFKNRNFSRLHGSELTTNFPELFDNENDKMFESLMKSCVDKNGYIVSSMYYKNIENILQSFGLNKLYCLLLFTDDFHLVGSADIGFMNDGMTVTITNFFIQKKYRGKKYGALLMKLVIMKIKEYKYIKKIILDVDINNIPATKLYRKMGFTAVDNISLKKRRMILLL